MPDLPGGDRVSMLDGAMLWCACLRVVSDEAAEMADALDMGFAVYHRTPSESGGDCGPLQVLGRYSIAGARRSPRARGHRCRVSGLRIAGGSTYLCHFPLP